jgi:peptide chain release factor 1
MVKHLPIQAEMRWSFIGQALGNHLWMTDGLWPGYTGIRPSCVTRPTRSPTPLMSFRTKLPLILQRYQELESWIASPSAPSSPDFAINSKEYANLAVLVQEIQNLNTLEDERTGLQSLLQDPDWKTVAQDELASLEKRLAEQELAVRTLLLPKDKNDDRNVIIEIRAGTGGEEAALFVGDLVRMYRRYGELKGWTVELGHAQDSDQGGLKEASLFISGKDVFACLKFEAGVHRVQRVPATESSGRLHTSTATVAVLPEAEEIDIHIEEKDLRIDVFRSSGPGGQSVNTTDSAVRITHLPSGLVVQQQDEKSQHKNKAKALKVLRARLYEKTMQEQEAARATSRHSQVGRGERSERIRTYNYPQGRLTDHRIKLTLYRLAQILEGDLDEVVQALITDDRALALAQEDGVPLAALSHFSDED